ncbi:MAG: metallophosphoesterase [Pirellulaceae bacterium]
MLLDTLLSLVAFLGHFSLCVWLFNRLHALPWRRFYIKWLGRAILGWGAAILVIYGLRAALTGVCVARSAEVLDADAAWLIYPMFCVLVSPPIAKWLVLKLFSRAPAALASNDTTLHDLAQEIGHPPIGRGETGLLARFPGNQIFRLAVQKKTLRLPTLPRELDGLTIAHLSDLHMTGKITCEFYDAIVDHTNRLEPDLVVITGDIAEKVECLDWIVPVLSRLRAREGKYFILGNHEMKLPDVDLLRRLMKEAGFIDIGSKAMRVKLRGVEILMAGSEVPWFGTNPLLTPDPCSLTPDFRLLLSHSPDQLPWAKANQFDLMLAGHTHGGQIRLPMIGALISPSRFGFRYAGGLYFEEPTLLHVSRGLCGDHPIRLNCPPELPLLKLIRGTESLCDA